MKRLLDETDDTFERALLGSVRLDEPPTDAIEKAAIALAGAAGAVAAAAATTATAAAGAAARAGGANMAAVGPGGAASASTAPPALTAGAGIMTKIGVLAAWKWVGLGVVAGAVATWGGVETVRAVSSARGREVSLSSIPTPSTAVAPAPKAAAPPSAPASAPVDIESEPPALQPPPLPTNTNERPAASAVHRAEPTFTGNAANQTAPPALTSPGMPPASSVEAVPNASALAVEADAVDRARKALADGSPGAALSVLDHYEHEVPTHVLAPDALVLRMEAQEANGNPSAAADLAERFLAAHPDDPHANRVRRLLKRVSKP